jgi:signal transduction histidine kinase/DNA-binding response OmpR family regulator
MKNSFIPKEISFSSRLLLLLTITLLLILTTNFNSSAQSSGKLDSLKTALKKHTIKDTAYLKDLIFLASQQRNEDIELSKRYYNEALSISKNLSAAKFEIKSNTGLGICSAMLDQHSDAIHFFENALKLSIQNRFTEYIGDSYNNLGVVYKSLDDYPLSLKFYAKSLKLYDSLNIEDGLAATYDNMGTLYDLMREPEKSIEHYLKSLAIYKKNNNVRKITTVNSNIAFVYLQQKEFQKAIDLYENNLKFYVGNGMKTYAVRENSNLGDAYYQIKNYHKAESVLSSTLAEAETLQMKEIQINTLYNLAKLKAELGNIFKSLEFANKAKLMADSLQNFRLKSKSQELLSFIYQRAGDYENALKHYKLHKTLEDSLYNESKLKAYKAQQVLLEVVEKNKQLDQQSVQLALLDQKVIYENRWKWFYASASILSLIIGVLYFQKSRIGKIYSKELEVKNRFITEQNEEIETINQQLEKQVQLRKETDETINYFATSLFGKNELEEILWDVAKNCVARLGFVDCVIYLLDESTEVLIQKAAYGTKNPEDFVIHNPLKIPVGKGIVGAVAQSGIAEIVNDASKDPRYIIDDEARFSELAVPLIHQNKVIGVIDSEHPEKDFYKQYHLEALTTIASICSSKISQARADSEAKKAKEAQVEAEQIKQMDLLKTQFFANVSHEFRTPLNLILAPLRKNRFPIPAWEVEMMGRNANRLLRLVNQLLDLAKIEVGLVKLENRTINVAKFISEIAHTFVHLAEAKGITFKVDIQERELVAFLDPDKLEKIIYNLLSNAFKFTPSGESVVIHVSKESLETFSISVTDTGIGIPEHLQEQVFNRFYQVNSSQTRPYEGTGIGLSLTKELVELMKGSITVKNNEGRGCVFKVCLSTNVVSDGLLEIDEAFPTELAQAGSYFQNLALVENDGESFDTVYSDNLPLVLVVEDNADLRKYIRTQIFHEFNVIEAPDGQVGLRLAQEKIPDLIITDIMMPEMDGVTMTKNIRGDERTSHIPIILLTARDDDETKLKGFETGAEQYLVKPFEINELLARIKSLLSFNERLKKKFSQIIMLKPEDVVIENRDATFLTKLVKIVEDNIANESFSVENLQKEIGMSRMQLHRKLKALTNQSANDFIRSIRLKRAAQILRQPGVQISEAAYLSGFNHLSYFSKCFKEQFGVLPSDYSKSTTNTD